MAARAALCSKAYRVLLREHGLEPDALRHETDLGRLPVLTKANTFGRFSLDELSRPIDTREIADVLTSSGRSGHSFGFKLTVRKQHESSWFDIDLGLQDAFNVDEKPTLLVNCLPMGVAFRSRAVTVANVSVREDMACSILRDVGPRFAQTILCTDPLFIRRILDEGQRRGIDWRSLNTSVIVGEEMLVEPQREYIAKCMGLDLETEPQRMIGSSFGVGELGLNLLFETRCTIHLQRKLRAARSTADRGADAYGEGAAPQLLCYNPMRCHVEVLNPDSSGFGELCFTMLDRQAVIPLPRFATGDLGRMLARPTISAHADRARLMTPWLPVVELHGRIADRSTDLPSVEQVKEWIYSDHLIAHQLSGAFRLVSQPRGGARLTLQLTGDARAEEDVRTRIQEIARLYGFTDLQVESLSASEFPWRPMLDFERKFPYLSGARSHG